MIFTGQTPQSKGEPKEEWGSQFWDFTRPGAVWTYFGDVYCDDPPCGKQDSHISSESEIVQRLLNRWTVH